MASALVPNPPRYKIQDIFEAPLLARDRLLIKGAKTRTSLSAIFPKFSGDFKLSVGDSVLVAKRYNKSKSL